jgi:hypothetical protein
MPQHVFQFCVRSAPRKVYYTTLQKNNSYLRRTAQNLRERLDLVRMVTTILKLTITEKLPWKQLVISCIEKFLTKKVVEGGGGGGLKGCSPEIFLRIDFVGKILPLPPSPQKKHGTHGPTDTNQE